MKNVDDYYPPPLQLNRVSDGKERVGGRCYLHASLSSCEDDEKLTREDEEKEKAQKKTVSLPGSRQRQLD